MAGRVAPHRADFEASSFCFLGQLIIMPDFVAIYPGGNIMKAGIARIRRSVLGGVA